MTKFNKSALFVVAVYVEGSGSRLLLLLASRRLRRRCSPIWGEVPAHVLAARLLLKREQEKEDTDYSSEGSTRMNGMMYEEDHRSNIM